MRKRSMKSESKTQQQKNHTTKVDRKLKIRSREYGTDEDDGEWIRVNGWRKGG